MSQKRKIGVITGTRAEYGLLFWLMKALQKDPEIDLQIYVTGMHLSPEFGSTYQQIEKDGFFIHKKIETLLSSDSAVGVSKSMALGMAGFADAFEELKPDLIVVLGDRFEIFAAVSAAMIARIPVAHCHGGEATEGLIDEPIRHSITKMSHLHFTATETYRNRVIQLGENPNRVFNVGALGIENINRMELMNRSEFEKSINKKLQEKNILITFHPVTLEKQSAKKQFQELLNVLSNLENTLLIFTKPNADTDGRIIIEMIDKFVAQNDQKAVSFISLGQLRYLSALQFMDAVVGNSSSGLIEVPSFQKATINIGDRQKGRIKAESVIDCLPKEKAIQTALEKVYETHFQEKLKIVKNPYGNENASAKILEILKAKDLINILKKEFYDLEAF